MPPPVVPHGLQKKLSVKLNQESVLGQDWTSLAEKLGLESCIEALKGRQDPTMDLFQAAHQKGKIESLEELAKLLEEMERQDCVDIIQNYPQNLKP
ncbi:UNC5C-like protein [Diadema antillarum]|uniref:UNC5C-like protein n=1 Tax=Diadema antillarum TaxID=105358 RepID=UPI003A84A150